MPAIILESDQKKKVFYNSFFYVKQTVLNIFNNFWMYCLHPSLQ